MASKEDGKLEARRSFLKLASVGSVAGAAAALVGGDQAQAIENAGSVGANGYRETAHVKKVYELSRF